MRTLVTAEWLIRRDLSPVKEGWVVIENGKIAEEGRGKVEGNFQKVFRYPGILLPPLVNAHTHLELSLLKFPEGTFKDFFGWLSWIIRERKKLSEEDILCGFRAGAKELEKNGVAFAGDISSFGVSGSEKTRVRIVSFREVIGRDADVESLPPPLSPHAVYSVSFGLLSRIARDARERGYRFQIHLGETRDEQAFVRCRENRFESEIYPLVGRTRYERVCAEELVDYLKKASALGDFTIAVHCTNLSRKELDALMSAGAGIVLCPRSNRNLGCGLPDVNYLLSYENVALGTDGLCSNTSLSVVKDARFLYTAFDRSIPPKKLLSMMTVQGARVLGIKDYGKVPVFTGLRNPGASEDVFSSVLFGTDFEILDFSESS